MRKSVKCSVTRSGRVWVAHVPKHDVFGQGATLRAVSTSVEQGLRLLGVAAEVTVTPVTPELEKLRSIERSRAAALREAVRGLARLEVGVGDIAQATGLPIGQVKALLATPGRASRTPVRPVA